MMTMTNTEIFTAQCKGVSATEVYRAAINIFNGMSGGEMTKLEDPKGMSVRIAMGIRDELIKQSEQAP